MKNTHKAETNQNMFTPVTDEMLATVAAGKIEDTDDKEWWEYVVDTADAIAKGFGHCFTGENTVSTPEGTKPIKDIYQTTVRRFP